MTTRADRIGTALSAIIDVDASEADDNRDVFERMATAVVDAVLPQVTTEIELNGLPPGSVVLTPDGDAWTRLPDAGDEWPGWQYLACGPINPKTLAVYGPLTVGHQPEGGAA